MRCVCGIKRIIAFFILYSSFFILPPQVAAYTTNMNASVVIGQENFTNSNANFSEAAISGRGFGTTGPAGIESDGTKLLISDFTNNRVLIWNKIPNSNGVAADVVIGQTDFSGGSANQGGSAAANTLSAPRKMTRAGEKLIVVDANNNRVLIYNHIPTQNNTAADVVIGQPDMATTGSGTSATVMSGPVGVYYDQASGKLAITETGNDRVLIYNGIPTQNGAAANVVLGQVDFVSTGTGTTGNKMTNPNDVSIIKDKVYVADLGNHRILIWNSIPTTNGTSADLVIGQQTLTATSPDQGLSDPTPSTIHFPRAISDDGRRLYVTDGTNNRILMYNSFPAANNQSADVVIGQPDFASDAVNQGGNAGANTTSAPIDALTKGSKLIVADSSNRRVLIFEDIINTPKPLFTTSPFGIADGKIRFEGEVSLSGGTHSIWKIEASVNGGPFGEVTSLWDTTRTNPGLPDDKIAKFIHDI